MQIHSCVLFSENNQGVLQDFTRVYVDDFLYVGKKHFMSISGKTLAKFDSLDRTKCNIRFSGLFLEEKPNLYTPPYSKHRTNGTMTSRRTILQTYIVSYKSQLDYTHLARHLIYVRFKNSGYQGKNHRKLYWDHQQRHWDPSDNPKSADKVPLSQRFWDEGQIECKLFFR